MTADPAGRSAWPTRTCPDVAHHDGVARSTKVEPAALDGRRETACGLAIRTVRHYTAFWGCVTCPGCCDGTAAPGARSSASRPGDVDPAGCSTRTGRRRSTGSKHLLLAAERGVVNRITCGYCGRREPKRRARVYAVCRRRITGYHQSRAGSCAGSKTSKPWGAAVTRVRPLTLMRTVRRQRRRQP